MSPSSRGRGLKYLMFLASVFVIEVALFTRAWIEIRNLVKSTNVILVALFTRAWIEIFFAIKNSTCHTVALFTRAWIEINILEAES